MGGAWAGTPPSTSGVIQPCRTADSAIAAARLAEEVGADEVFVVTSWWHRPRWC